MSRFCAGMRQGDIMIFTCPLRVEREVELVFPAELKTGLGQGIIAQLGTGMSLSQVCGVSSNLICHHPFAHVRICKPLIAGFARILPDEQKTRAPLGIRAGSQRPDSCLRISCVSFMAQKSGPHMEQK